MHVPPLFPVVGQYLVGTSRYDRHFWARSSPQETTQVSHASTLIWPFLFLLLHIYHMIMLYFNSHACASTIASVRLKLCGHIQIRSSFLASKLPSSNYSGNSCLYFDLALPLSVICLLCHYSPQSGIILFNCVFTITWHCHCHVLIL